MSSGRDLFAPRLGVAMPLAALHFIFFLLQQSDPARTHAAFAFDPAVAVSRPWTFVTYQFLHSGPLSLFFGALVFYILGSALEAEWGTAEFVVFWLVATVTGSGAAFALGAPLASGGLTVDLSMLFTFAWLFPETRFLIFFVLPVKVTWLAWFSAAGLVFVAFSTAVTAGFLAAIVVVLGGSGGFLFFLARHQAAWRARKAVREAATIVKTAGAIREDSQLERRNRELFPKVEALRQTTRDAAAAGAELPKDKASFAAELATLVVPAVKICKPVDFKGDRDGVCVRCEGFAECSLRYVAGQPAEIVVKERT